VPAFTVLRAGAFSAGAVLAAVVFTALGHALACFNLAIAFGVRAIFFGHGCYLLKRLTGERGSYRATATTDPDGRFAPAAGRIVKTASYRCLLFRTATLSDKQLPITD
jgi:hypothetical protein